MVERPQLTGIRGGGEVSKVKSFLGVVPDVGPVEMKESKKRPKETEVTYEDLARRIEQAIELRKTGISQLEDQINALQTQLKDVKSRQASDTQADEAAKADFEYQETTIKLTEGNPEEEAWFKTLDQMNSEHAEVDPDLEA